MSSIFGSCKRCGWERPSGNSYHTREACDDMYVDNLEAENTALKQRLEYIGELTGVAGVDEPMSIEDCVAALQAENAALKAGQPWLKGATTEYLLQKEIAALKRYSDKLADGLPEGMLPKDVELIKDANAKMATEIIKLKREVETVCDILVDCDGYRTPEGLMGLIDEVHKCLADALLKETN